MSKDLQIFDFKGQRVRTGFDESGEPLFVAKDVCDALEISRYRDALARLDDDDKGCRVLVDTPGGLQEMAAVTEPGLYDLILQSRKPEAKAFKRWIKREVIPSIRKTGGYQVDGTQSLERYEAETRRIEAEGRILIARERLKIQAMTESRLRDKEDRLQRKAGINPERGEIYSSPTDLVRKDFKDLIGPNGGKITAGKIGLIAAKLGYRPKDGATNPRWAISYVSKKGDLLFKYSGKARKGILDYLFSEGWKFYIPPDHPELPY